MSLSFLNSVLDELSDDALANVAVGMVKEGVMSTSDFGGLVRKALTADIATVATVAAAEAILVDVAPINASREAFLSNVYSAFEGTRRRRSIKAISLITGFTNRVVLEVLEGNSDFRITEGRETGRTFISVRGGLN